MGCGLPEQLPDSAHATDGAAGAGASRVAEEFGQSGNAVSNSVVGPQSGILRSLYVGWKRDRVRSEAQSGAGGVVRHVAAGIAQPHHDVGRSVGSARRVLEETGVLD